MDEIFTALARATGAGGTLLIHGYTPEQVALGTGGPGNPDHMYTTDMLANAFLPDADHSEPRLYRHPRRRPRPLWPLGPD